MEANAGVDVCGDRRGLACRREIPLLMPGRNVVFRTLGVSARRQTASSTRSTMESPGDTEREGTTTMATTKITPVNPDTEENDEAKDAAAERKTASAKALRKMGRKTAYGKIV